MVMIDRAELRKMRPDQRIEKLKALEDEIASEIHEKQEAARDAQRLIHESVGEMERQRFAELIPAPEPESPNISAFSPAQKNPLEPIPGEEPPQIRYEVIDAYNFVKEAAYSSMTYTRLAQDTLEQLGEVESRLEGIAELNHSKEVADMLVAARSVLDNIKKYNRVETVPREE
jgi:hypothetical protein